jgi:hypothetical protein
MRTVELENDKDYDHGIQLVAKRFHGNGYHSRLADGTPIHDIRLSADYALACLREGGKARIARAAGILDRLCSLQDVDPVSRTYGIWAWTYEETLAQMDPPDWNWADFIGVRIAQALRFHADALPAETVEKSRAALSHAAWSIFRRNVAADYTNIAIMGAVATAAAGEILDQPFLLAYARRRFLSLKESVEVNGSFNEYNSPTYTVVAIEELDRLATLVRDAECNAIADFLRRHAWEIVAEHFHPATAQWAGPHARAYSDLLGPDTARWLSAATGRDIVAKSAPAGFKKDALLVAPRPCPPELLSRFRSLPEPEFSLTRQFCVRNGVPIVGTTWMSQTACLASVNRDNTWVQRRFLIGYWNAEGAVAVLKLGVLLNGREFPGFRVVQHQRGPRVLSALQPLYGTGCYHPTLNTVDDGRFDVDDLRIRYSLIAADARSAALPDGRFALSAGGWQAVVTAAPSLFNGAPVVWQIGEIDGGVAVEGLIHVGGRKRIDFAAATMRAAMGVELVEDLAKASSAPVRTSPASDGILRAEWDDLHVETSVGAERFAW